MRCLNLLKKDLSCLDPPPHRLKMSLRVTLISSQIKAFSQMESDSRKFQFEKSIQSVRYACTSVTLNLIQLPIQFHIVSWTFFRKRLIHCCQSLNGGSESGKWNWVSASSKLINIWVLILPPQAKRNSPTRQNIEQIHFSGVSPMVQFAKSVAMNIDDQAAVSGWRRQNQSVSTKNSQMNY